MDENGRRINKISYDDLKSRACLQLKNDDCYIIRPANLIEKENTFMNTFIHSQTRKFATTVYGLGGRHLYEFLRFYLKTANCSLAYGSEDCTTAINKIHLLDFVNHCIMAYLLFVNIKSMIFRN